MSFLGKFALDGDGAVRATVEAPSTTGIVNGAAYLDDVAGASYACVSTEAVAAADGVIGGFRYTTAGALRVSDVTAGVPASSSVNQGILMTDDGQVCFSGAAGTAVVNGVSVTADGAVSMQVMSFLLEFADLGDGAVDTAVTFGGEDATFTRATAATTVGPTGLVVSVASGVARSYYDPTSLEYLGYLAEGARTNLCLQSEDFATTWTNNGSTETTNAAASPDGASTADAILDTAADVVHEVTQSITKAASSLSYAISVWAKYSSKNLYLEGANAASTAGARANFDLQAGTATPSAAFGAGFTTVGATIKAYPNGWYRCELQLTTDTDTTLKCALRGTNGAYLGTGAIMFYLWGAQVEQAAFASSYIPTTTAAVARNADVLTYPTTAWLNADAGTLYAEYQSFSGTAAARYVASLDDGTNNERIQIYLTNANEAKLFVNDGNVTQANISSGTFATNTDAAGATAYAVNDFAVSGGGASVATDTSGSLPTVTQLQVGIGIADTATFGPIRRLAYYPSRLPNATLQSLTE